jgi:hypothetical protein
VLKAAAQQPAGEVGVREVIGKAFGIYPQPDRSDGEWAAWWGAYVDVLRDVPWPALQAGMNAHIRDPKSEFMPKPGKLLELSRTTKLKVIQAYTRAKAAVQQIAHCPPPGHEVPTLELQSIPEMARTALDKLTIRREPICGTPPASTGGKPDEGGLTPLMRALMAKRQASPNAGASPT